MNKVILIGNLCRDPERRTTQNGTSVTTFSVAVQRNYKNAEGGYDADFINCVAWRGTADFVANYFSKGEKICLEGSLTTRSYEAKDGGKKTVTEVSVDKAEFVSPKSAVAEEKKESEPAWDDDFFKDMRPADESELPF